MSFSGGQGDLFAGPAPADVDDWDADAREPLEVGAWPRDCANVEGLRPCPFVSCRSHLLIDEVYAGPSAPNLAINRASRPDVPRERLRGRRKELSPDASRAKVAAFADDAMAALWRLPDTCAREVARRAHDDEQAAASALGRAERIEVMTFAEIAAILGDTSNGDGIEDEFGIIVERLRGEAIEAGADPTVEGEAVEALAGRGNNEPRR